ncbi:hypothetical protein DFH09DRAFT_1329891 [Mycena vulgaris]|nr:hypothetical protein DFH09DRAFT_1329891 [Mycena vulgaris]
MPARMHEQRPTICAHRPGEASVHGDRPPSLHETPLYHAGPSCMCPADANVRLVLRLRLRHRSVRRAECEGLLTRAPFRTGSCITHPPAWPHGSAARAMTPPYRLCAAFPFVPAYTHPRHCPPSSQPLGLLLAPQLHSRAAIRSAARPPPRSSTSCDGGDTHPILQPGSSCRDRLCQLMANDFLRLALKRLSAKSVPCAVLHNSIPGGGSERNSI